MASLLSLAAAIAWPQQAVAHVQGGEAAGFLSGILHPVSGLDHVLAMISVGLGGAQLGAPALWLLPVTFPMVMAFGGMLGLMGLALPGVEIGIVVSALGLGLAILLELRPPLWGAALVVGFFAVFHGHAHGTELPEGAQRSPVQRRVRGFNRLPPRNRYRAGIRAPLGLRSSRPSFRGCRCGPGGSRIPVAGAHLRR